MSQPNRSRATPPFRLVAVAALVMATAGCGDATIGSAGAPTVAPTTVAGASSSTGGTGTAGARPGDLAFDAATTTTTPSTVPTTAPAATAAPTTAAAPTTTAPPPFPAATAALVHGGRVWAVVLAGAPAFDDPRLDLAVAAAADAGYQTGWTDCDDGAAEALGLAPDASVFTVSVYFAVEADALAAAAAFRAGGTPASVGLVTTYCLD